MDFAPANEHPLDPFPQYEQMREAAPVYHDGQTGSWHVFRYDDVQRVLSEHARFSSRMGGDESSEAGQLFADAPHPLWPRMQADRDIRPQRQRRLRADHSHGVISVQRP